MDADPAQLLQYYRRAAEDAGVFKRQGPDEPTSTGSTLPPESSTALTSSLSTASTASTLSTASTRSTASTLSTRSTQSSSSSRPPSSAAPSSSTAIMTTTSSAIQTTDSQGQVITSFIFVSATSTVPATTGGGTQGKSTNTGAIVGGVVGGIALVVLVALGIWLVRRKMKKDEFEANIFDPDRNVERPTSMRPGQNFDMAAAGVTAGRTSAAEREATNVTPYPYAPTSTGPATASHYGSSVGGQPEMQQAHTGLAYYHDVPQATYQDNNYGNWNANTPTVNVGETFPNPYGPNYHPAAMGGAAAAGGAAAIAAHRGYTTSPSNASSYPASSYPPTSVYSPPPPDTGRISPNSPPMAAGTSLAPTNARSAKEREAFSRTYQNQGYMVSNQSETGAPARSNPSPTPSRSSAAGGAGPTSPVRVHQDGGRVPDADDDDAAGEIPPTYDSIPRDHVAR